jgi:hypothetical protein
MNMIVTSGKCVCDGRVSCAQLPVGLVDEVLKLIVSHIIFSFSCFVNWGIVTEKKSSLQLFEAVRFEILTAVEMSVLVFCVVTACRVDLYEFSLDDGDSLFLRNVEAVLFDDGIQSIFRPSACKDSQKTVGRFLPAYSCEYL